MKDDTASKYKKNNKLPCFHIPKNHKGHWIRNIISIGEVKMNGE